MTKKGISEIVRDHKWGLGIIGAALSVFAGSYFVDDLKNNAAVVAIVAAVGGLIKTWLESQTRRLEQSTQQGLVQANQQGQKDAKDTNEAVVAVALGCVKESIDAFKNKVVSLEASINEKHEENKEQFEQLKSDKDENERRFTVLEEGQKELRESHADLKISNAELKQGHQELRDGFKRMDEKLDAALKSKT